MLDVVETAGPSRFGQRLGRPVGQRAEDAQSRGGRSRASQQSAPTQYMRVVRNGPPPTAAQPLVSR